MWFHVIPLEDSPVEVEEQEQEEDDGPAQQNTGKIGAKKQRKLEEKQAKKAQREVRVLNAQRHLDCISQLFGGFCDQFTSLGKCTLTGIRDAQF